MAERYPGMPLPPRIPALMATATKYLLPEVNASLRLMSFHQTGTIRCRKQGLVIVISKAGQSKGPSVLKALERCASGADLPWILEICFGEPFRALSAGRRLFSSKPSAPRLVGVRRIPVLHPRPENRRTAMLVLSFSSVPAEQQGPLLQRLLKDSDADVRALARLQLVRVTPHERT